LFPAFALAHGFLGMKESLWLKFWFEQIGELGISLDEPGYIRTVGNDFPIVLSRLGQGGASQLRSDALSAKCIWDEGVLEGDAVAIDRIAQE